MGRLSLSMTLKPKLPHIIVLQRIDKINTSAEHAGHLSLGVLGRAADPGHAGEIRSHNWEHFSVLPEEVAEEKGL